jgi:hypothetical protein
MNKLPVTVFLASIAILTALWLRRSVRLQASVGPSLYPKRPTQETAAAPKPAWWGSGPPMRAPGSSGGVLSPGGY